MKISLLLPTASLLSLFAISAGCSVDVDSDAAGATDHEPASDPSSDIGTGDGDTDGDTDVDTDVDSDIDADIDSDTETDDADGGAPPLDGGSHGDTNSDGDTDSDRDTNSDTDSAPDTAVDSASDRDTETDSAPPDTTRCETGNGPNITDVAVVENPNSVLSCYLSWKTDVPSIADIYFGKTAYTYRIAEETPAVDHKVLLIGMHAESLYRIKIAAHSADRTETGVEKALFRTRSLPDIVPVLTPGPEGAVQTNASWTLTNIHNYNPDEDTPAVIAMYDDFGKPVWYYVHGTTEDNRGDIDARLLKSNHLLVGPGFLEPAREIDLSGNVLWEGPDQDIVNRLHHHFDKLPDGNYVGIRGRFEGDLVTDFVTVMTPEHESIWEWELIDHLAPAPDAAMDWSHANSLTFDRGDLALYFNTRNLSTLFKVDMTGEHEILWRLGQDGDFLPDPNAEDPWFIHQHEPELQPDGNILIYDNGDETRPHSRIVEYALNEEDMTSEIVFEFPGDFEVDDWYRDSWYTLIWGDADRMESGNTLVTAGTRDGGDAESRIFEVTPEGEVIRELRFPRRNGLAVGTYRSQRIEEPPLLDILCDPKAGCDLEGCAAPGDDFEEEPVIDADAGLDEDGGTPWDTDTGTEVDTETDTEPAPLLFPIEWNFNSGWDDFEGPQFNRNAAEGVLFLDHTFQGADGETVAAYRDLDGADWTGLTQIVVRLRTIDSESGGWRITLISGYGWTQCSVRLPHTETAEWTEVSFSPDADCNPLDYSPGMVQQLGIVVEPGTDAAFPESVQAEIDSVIVYGYN